MIQSYLLECQEIPEGNTEQTFTSSISTLLLKSQMEISLGVLSIHCGNVKMVGINRNSIEKIDSIHLIRKIQNRCRTQMLHFTTCIFNPHLNQNIHIYFFNDYCNQASILHMCFGSIIFPGCVIFYHRRLLTFLNYFCCWTY